MDPGTCSCENDKYARSVGDSVVIEEIIEKTKTIPKKVLQQIFTFY